MTNDFEGSSGYQIAKYDLLSYDEGGIDSILYMGDVLRSPFATPFVKSTFVAKALYRLPKKHGDDGDFMYSFKADPKQRTDFLLNNFSVWRSPEVRMKAVPAPQTVTEANATSIRVKNDSDVFVYPHQISTLSDVEVAQVRYRTQFTPDLLINFITRLTLAIGDSARESITSLKMKQDLEYNTSAHTREILYRALGNRDILTTPITSPYVGSGDEAVIPRVCDLMHVPCWSWMSNRFVDSNDLSSKSTNFPLLYYYGEEIKFHVDTIKKEDMVDLLVFEREIMRPLSVNGKVIDVFDADGRSVYASMPGYSDLNPSDVFPNRPVSSIDVGHLVLNGKLPYAIPTDTYKKISKVQEENDGNIGRIPENIIDVSTLLATTEAPQMWVQIGSVTSLERKKFRESTHRRIVAYKTCREFEQSVAVGETACFKDIDYINKPVSHIFFAVENTTARNCGYRGNYSNDADGFTDEPAYKSSSLSYNSMSHVYCNMPPVYNEVIEPLTSAATLPSHNCGIGLISKSLHISQPYDISGSFTPSKVKEQANSGIVLSIKTRNSVTSEALNREVLAMQRKSSSKDFIPSSSTQEVLDQIRMPTRSYNVKVLVYEWNIDQSSAFDEDGYCADTSYAVVGYSPRDVSI